MKTECFSFFEDKMTMRKNKVNKIAFTEIHQKTGKSKTACAYFLVLLCRVPAQGSF